MIGRTILHYKILEKLGEGGMGVVYKARDTKLDRLVALKFLPERLTVSDTEKARFLQEAKAAAALNHPNVCVIYEIQEQVETPFIAMEYVDGKTMRDIIAADGGGPLPPDQAIAYAIQIGEALQEAHSNDVVHRDVKSENIMVNAKKQIKVMDFGLAKLKGSLKLTKTSSTIGTLAYMSPEQIQTSKVDARSDIFSFGVVLYEMLTGRLPFAGDYEAAMMYAILNEEPDPLQKHVPDAPSELLHILNRALEKDPQDRYQSMADLVSELRRLKKQSSRVSRKSLAEMPVPPPATPTSAETAATATSPTGKRKLTPAVWIAGAVAVAAIAAFFAIKFTGHTDKAASHFQEMRIKRLSTSGNVWQAAISGDGKYLVQEIREGNKSSLWLRQVEINSNVQIAAPEEAIYGKLSFAPDGNQIYYTKRQPNAGAGTLYKMPVLGGDAKRILSGVQSGLSFSPDGSEIAVIRHDRTKGVYQVVIASADGASERNLVEQQENKRIF